MAEEKPKRKRKETPAKETPGKAARKSESAVMPTVEATERSGAATAAVAVISGRPVRTRGRTFSGTVVSNRMAKTVTVEWERRAYLPKYQRFERRRTRVKAHDETGARIGDTVEIMETRPISKTKHFIVIRKL